MLEATHNRKQPHCITTVPKSFPYTGFTSVVSLTQLMLPRVVGELDDQQVPAFRAAADAVHVRDVGALGRGSLQQTVHLGVGGVDKLDNGAGLFRMEASQRQLLSGWRQRFGKGDQSEKRSRATVSLDFFLLPRSPLSGSKQPSCSLAKKRSQSRK